MIKKPFLFRLTDVQPSQLYISSALLSKILLNINPNRPEQMAPLSLKELDDITIFTDGHTRALAAFLTGFHEVNAVWDEDDMEWEAYRTCVQWCHNEGITTIADLQARVVNPEEYQVLWVDRCVKMQQNIKYPPYAPRKLPVKLESG
jgi:hypothetical protein